MASPAAVLSKSCSRCGEEKPLDEFYRDPRTSLGRASACSACERERARAVRETPERQEYMLGYQRRHRADNREYYREKNAREYWRDPEKRRVARRRWLQENRERSRADAREYYGRAYADPEKRARMLEQPVEEGQAAVSEWRRL